MQNIQNHNCPGRCRHCLGTQASSLFMQLLVSPDCVCSLCSYHFDMLRRFKISSGWIGLSQCSRFKFQFIKEAHSSLQWIQQQNSIFGKSQTDSYSILIFDKVEQCCKCENCLVETITMENGNLKCYQQQLEVMTSLLFNHLNGIVSASTQNTSLTTHIGGSVYTGEREGFKELKNTPRTFSLTEEHTIPQGCITKDHMWPSRKS